MARKSPKGNASRDPGTVQVTLTLRSAVVARLDGHARAEQRSRSNAASLLLEQALDAAQSRAG